jgi:hypothetical protein
MRERFAVLVLASFAGGCFQFSAKSVQSVTETYPLAAEGILEVSSFNGRIEVRPGDGPGVRLERTTTCRARTMEEAQAGLLLIVPEIRSTQACLSFKVDDPSSWSHRFEVDLTAWVPEACTVTLRTSNGVIEVDGIEGDVDAHTSNGRISVRESGRSRVNLKTSNGNIDAERLSGAVEARTGNGRIVLRDCPGRIQAASSNGMVEIDAGRGVDPGGIAVETSNGRVRCLLPAAFSGEVDARTSNGSVRCEFPVEVRHGEKHRGRLLGRIGRGGGPAVRITTSNGPVEIHRSGAPAETPDLKMEKETGAVGDTRKV